jgi:uncharacterized protein with GYD domain
MAYYIMHVTWTDEGIKKVKESPARLDAFKKGLKAAGGELRDYFLVMGSYDLLAVISAPDDAAAAKIALASASLGSVRTDTHRAFTEEEYRKIIGGLP